MLTADTVLYSKIDRVFYYTDATGITLVGPTIVKVLGSNIGQKNAPSRGKGELVGTATGKRQQNSSGLVMVEVEWTNRYYLSKANLFTPGGYVNESKTSWVKESQVDFSMPVVDEPKPGGSTIPTTGTSVLTDPTTGSSFLGTNSSTLATNPSQSNNNMVWIIVGGAVLVVAALLIYFRQPKRPTR